MRLRRSTGGRGASPPAGENYGPTPGADWVRNNAGPRPVTDPGGGYTFTSIVQLNSLIATYPSGSKFVAAAGATQNWDRRVADLGKHPKIYFLGDASLGDGSTVVIDGGGYNEPLCAPGATGGIELYGGQVQNFDWDYGAILIRGDSTVADMKSMLNKQHGFRAQGDPEVGLDGAIVFSHCWAYQNERYGMGSTADRVGVAGPQDVTVESCIIEGNNTGAWATADDAGGTKFLGTSGTWRYNWVKNNIGVGLWWDGRNVNVLCEENVIENNGTTFAAPVYPQPGIFYEISGPDCVIQRNYVAGNGGTDYGSYPYNGVAQIVVSCSPLDGSVPMYNMGSAGGEIRSNDVVTRNGRNAPVLLFNHSSHPDAYRTRKWNVHHNRFKILTATSTYCRHGLADYSTALSSKEGDIGTSPAAPGLCLFDHNVYWLANTDPACNYFEHDTSRSNPGPIAWAQFRAEGHEANGIRCDSTGTPL